MTSSEMVKIFVCTNKRDVTTGQPSCGGRGSLKLVELLRREIETRDLRIEVKTSVCFGHCAKGPNVKVAGQPFRHGLHEQDVGDFVESLCP